MRKGSTEMWWIIIGAVIALIVLIILLVLFTGKTQGLEGGLTECEGKSGVCATSPTDNTSPCPSNTIQTSAFTCTGNQVCCVGITKSCKDASDSTQACGDKECKDYPRSDSKPRFLCSDELKPAPKP